MIVGRQRKNIPNTQEQVKEYCDKNKIEIRKGRHKYITGKMTGKGIRAAMIRVH